MTIERNDILAVIPTYNNEKTLARVIGEVQPLLHGRAGGERRVDRLDGGDNRRGGVGSISYAPNRGKGYALRRRCATPRSTATVTC